jgi:hypothetical protein
LLRSIETDYDIAYHKRAIAKCLEDIQYHARALVDVEYDPYYELDNAEDQCAIMKEELSFT